jgi:hypothetical protein
MSLVRTCGHILPSLRVTIAVRMHQYEEKPLLL